MREEERGVIAELVGGKASTMRVINEAQVVVGGMIVRIEVATIVLSIQIMTTLILHTTTKTIIQEQKETQKLADQKEVINGETGESKRIQQ